MMYVVIKRIIIIHLQLFFEGELKWKYLLKIICGFYEPTTGEILFDGTNIIKKRMFPPNTRTMLEKPNFLPNLTGLENLQLLANIQKKLIMNKQLKH